MDREELIRLLKTCKERFCKEDEEWKKCFRRNALIHHPDKGGEQENFKELNNCNSMMAEPERARAMMEREMAARAAAERARAAEIFEIDNINIRYPLPDNTKELIVKADIVPDAYCEGKIALTTVIFPPINDREIITAVLAAQRRTGRMLHGFIRKLVDFMAQYTQVVIGNRAFKGCISLTSITLPPKSLRTIGNQAFKGCSSLTSITLPDSVTTIGKRAFSGCSSLTSITLPDSVTTIEDWVFRDCSSLESVDIPNSVTSIEFGAFYGCSSLTSMDIPNSVTSIEFGAFKGCSSLTSITLPDSLKTIEKEAFSGCRSLTSITLPDSLTRIGDLAFKDCSSLTSITLPDSLTRIGNRAFKGCSSLMSIMWCYQTFRPLDVVNGTLQNALNGGCQRSFTNTFR